jgi:hypothetical protein
MTNDQQPAFVLDLEADLSDSDVKSIQTGMRLSYDLGRRAAAEAVSNLKTTKAKTIKIEDAIKAAKGE